MRLLVLNTIFFVSQLYGSAPVSTPGIDSKTAVELSVNKPPINQVALAGGDLPPLKGDEQRYKYTVEKNEDHTGLSRILTVVCIASGSTLKKTKKFFGSKRHYCHEGDISLIGVLDDIEDHLLWKELNALYVQKKISMPEIDKILKGSVAQGFSDGTMEDSFCSSLKKLFCGCFS